MSYDNDPFAGGDRTPALSFKNSKPGDSWSFKVTGPAKLLQTKDFDTDELAFWDDEKTQPKMAAVLPVEINGEARSVWATKPSSLFTALATAQREAGAQFAPGGTGTITHTEDEAPKNKKFSPRKIYTATYTPANALADGDAPF